MNLPLDGDARAVSSIYQPLKEAADTIAYCMSLLAGGIAPWSATVQYAGGAIVSRAIGSSPPFVLRTYRAYWGPTPPTLGAAPESTPYYWERIAFSDSQLPGNPLFGRGTGGTGAWGSNFNYDSPIEYSSLTIATGVTVKQRAILQVSGTLTLSGTAKLERDGLASSLSQEEDSGTFVRVGQLRAGTRGGFNDGSPTVNTPPVSFPNPSTYANRYGVVACGSKGGQGGDGTSAGHIGSQVGGNIYPSSWTPTAEGFLTAPPGFWVGSMKIDATNLLGFWGCHPLAGGMGGGAGSYLIGGGAGGSGAGVVWIAAKHLVVGSSGIHFSAKGSAGADVASGSSSPGGGGSGGLIVILYETADLPAGSSTDNLYNFTNDGNGVKLCALCDTSGGAAGTGGSHTDYPSTAGDPGKVILIQVPGRT
jgi:hypothetical protein